MKKYIVTYNYLCQDTFEIEAKTKAEAIQQAEQELVEFETKVIKRFPFKAKLRRK